MPRQQEQLWSIEIQMVSLKIEDIKVKESARKTLEQAIGFYEFLMVMKNLDMTSIHPESYDVAALILKKVRIYKNDIGSSELQEKIASLGPQRIHKRIHCW